MSKLITRIKRSALALCLATPIVSWAATTYSTDYSVTGSETAYTSNAGNANVYWQNFNFRAAVDKDNLEHGYYFFLKDGDTDIGETGVAVKLDSITLTWGNNTDSFGADDTPYLVVTTPDDNSPVIIGVSDAGDKRVANGTSTFPFSNVVLASNAKYRFYFYKNDVSSLSVGTVLTGAQQARINGRWHNTQGDARADYNDIRCSGGTGYSINCSFVVSPLEEGDAVVLETGDASIPLAAADTPVVVEGKVVDGAVDVGSEVAVDGVLTVCGEATTLVLTDSLTATAFYFPATVTIDASAVSGLDPTGDDSSKTTTLLSGALKYMTAPTVVLPAATAGMIYETNVTASGISVTVVKGVDCVETITANTVWSDIKPEGWIDSVVGDKPSIEITYEGEEPVTLTFDEVVTAGTLTLTGNIVVEASAAATFGTVSAGAGSVVEMANMTITTQSGSGVYRYRTGYPSTVPNHSLTYEYVGTDDSENPGTVNLNGMRGVVRTTGYMSITGYYPVNTGAKLDVVSGTTTLTAGGQAICGYITIREGATLVNTATDSLAYSSYSSIIDIYGTLDMGTSRWTTWSGAAINLRGGEVVGVGEGNNGALDFMGTCNITAYADSTISGNIKFRNALSNVTVNDGVTLTISGETKQGYDGGGITKKGNGTLKFTSDPYVPGGIVVEDGTLAFDTESDVDPVVTYTAAVLNSENMDYASASNWKGRIVISAVEAGTTSTQVALNKTGNENSYLTLSGVSGNAWCANDNYTVQPAITLAGDVNFENGYSSKAVTFRKIAAGTGNLSLKSWASCTGITYGFTTLDADNYTGTIQLDGSVLTFNVGDILKANAQPGNKVLPLTVANNATVNLANATVNGVAANLELRADGIYLVNTVTVTIPNVPNTTVAVTANGETVTGNNGSYVVPQGSEVVATYTAVDGYELGGVASYNFTATDGYNLAEEQEVTVTTTQYVAAFNGTSYTTLSAAVSAWAAADSETAQMNPITMKADVNETVTIPARADGIPLQVTGTATINGQVTVEAGTTFAPFSTVTLGGSITVAGALYRIGSNAVTIGGDLTLADGATITVTGLSTEAPVYSVAGDVVAEGALTIYIYSSTLEAGTYTIVSGASVSKDKGADVTVNLNGTESSNWVLDATETTLQISGAAALVDGQKFETFADAAVAANGEKTITLLASAAYTLAVNETLIVDANGFTMTVSAPEGYAVAQSGTGVVTYTTQVYVANLWKHVIGTTAWKEVGNYTSIRAAIAAISETDSATVNMLVDDSISFAEAGLVLDLGFPLTINGNDHTIYGVSDANIKNVTSGAQGDDVEFDGVNGSNVRGFFVKSGNVTFQNVTFTEFGDTAYVNKFGYTPIQTASAYTGTLTLTGVNFNKFNRTAVCVRGGTLSMTGGTIAGGTVNKDVLEQNKDYFQQPVEVRGGTASINGVTITGGDSFPTKGNGGGAIVAWGATTVNNVVVDFTGYGIWSDGPAVTVAGEGTSVEATVNAIFAEEGGVISVSAGDFTGPLAVDSDPNSGISITGGTFSVDPSAYVASGYKATESAGVWTVSKKSGIDPTDQTSTQEVTPSEQEIADAGSAEAAAKNKATVTVPEAVATATGVTEETYKSYFTLSATETAPGSGVYEVAIVELNEDVVFPTSESDELTADLADVLDVAAGDDVEITTAKPGLYYSIEAANSVDFATGKVEGTRELATTTTVSPAKPAKTGTAVFYRVKVSATPNTNN